MQGPVSYSKIGEFRVNRRFPNSVHCTHPEPLRGQQPGHCLATQANESEEQNEIDWHS